MIFPILQGLVDWRRAPVTWCLIALNFLTLVYTSLSVRDAQTELESMMREEYFVTTQGRVYASYLTDPKRASEYPPFLLDLAHQVSDGRLRRAETLGQLAFRDFTFLDEAADLAPGGDEVAFAYWRRNLARVKEDQAVHPSFRLGLNAGDPSLAKWVTYVFVHSGFSHFIGNMLFLLIFGAALEAQVGGLGVLVTFVLSGVLAAGVFATVTGVTTSPLVGASGAVSGLMALYCTLNWRNPTRYFYWLFIPARGFAGYVFLPSWIAFALWLLSDLAGYIGTLPELGGVAHTAHLGGEVAGVVTALTLFAIRSARTRVASYSPSPPPVSMNWSR